MSSQCQWWQILMQGTTRKQTNIHTFWQTFLDTNAISIALKWPALDLWAQGTRKRCTSCIHSWEKTWKDQFLWTTWTRWLGMAPTRSGCPGRTPPSPLPPTSSHTLVTCPSDSLDIYFNLWTPPASLPSLPEQAPQSTVSITLISTYLFGILFSWIHDMSWASTVKCLNPLSCYQHIWTPCLSTYICNKHELCWSTSNWAKVKVPGNSCR